VLDRSDPAPVQAAAASVAVHTQRLALRVPMASISAKPAVLTGVTTAISANTGIPVTAVDVIFDWADALEAVSLDNLEKTTAAAMAALGSQHGQLITIGTPNSDAFKQAGDWVANRREWWLWLRLAHAGLDVTYGDYALYPPSDPVPAGPLYGHLRYSAEDRMHVHRRAIPQTGGGLGAAFGVCCKHLVSQKHWLGAAYSKADKRLSNIAADADKESSAGMWRQVAVQHHLAVVAKQLASPPGPPPAGTP
jgi:hypothetical protein